MQAFYYSYRLVAVAAVAVAEMAAAHPYVEPVAITQQQSVLQVVAAIAVAGIKGC